MNDHYIDKGFARLDLSRRERTGMPETVFCPGKTNEQLRDILLTLHQGEAPVLGTRCTPEQYDFLTRSGLDVCYDALSRVLVFAPASPRTTPSLGRIAVCTGGTADVPVAEESARVAEFFGAEVQRFYDVGIAGLHRLLSCVEDIRRSQVVIAVAGMEGALASVLAGLVKAPVIAVPTSVGYGASFHGLAPLLTMLNSCAEGVSVVNIDNGFGAAVQACRILSLPHQHE